MEVTVEAGESPAHEPCSTVEATDQPGSRRSDRSRRKPKWLNDYVEN